MPKLPDTLGPTALPTPQRRVWGVDNTQVLEAEGKAAAQLKETGRDMMVAADDLSKQQEKDALLESVRRDNAAQQEVNTLLYGDGTENNPGLYSAKGANALGAQKTFDEKFKEIKARAMEGVGNPVAQAALEKSLMQMDTGTKGSLQRYVQEQRRGYSVDLLNARDATMRERVGYEYNNKNTIDNALKAAQETGAAEAKIAGFVPGDGAYENLIRKKTSGILATQVNTMLGKNDPAIMAQGIALYDQYGKDNKLDFETRSTLEKVVEQARPKVEAYNVFRSIGGGQGDDIEFVMQDLEGGDQLVPDGDGRARFGINDGPNANPDVNLDTLDATGAKALYKERYWDAYGIGDLPRDMQLLAFDTTVNHRSGFKEDVIKAIKNGATQDDIFNMRLNEYERLAKADPDKYAAQLPGWKNRLAKLYDRVNGDAGPRVIDPGAAAATAAQLKPEAQKEFLSLVDNNNKALIAAQTQERKDVTGEALDVLNTGGGFAALSPDLLARVQATGVMPDLEKYTGATDKDMAAFLYSMDPATLAQTDLDDPAIRLKLSPADYDRWTQKKERLSSTSNLVTEERRKKIVTEAFVKRNVKTDKQEGKERVIRYNEMLDLEIDAFAEQNNGRYPNEGELTKITDSLFLKGEWDIKGFNDAEYVYDIDVEDIPNKDRAQIEAALQSSGVAVTNAAIIKTWVIQNGQ